MADGEELGQRIAALHARLDADIAKARDPRDGDGDGKINDGTPSEGPALGAVEKPGGHGSEGKAMATVGFVGNKTDPAKVMPGEPHPTVLKDIGQEAAEAVWAKIEAKAPAAELMAALEPAAAKMRLITPTISPDMTPEAVEDFIAGRTYEGGRDAAQTVEGLIDTAKSYAKGELAYDRKMTIVVGPPAAGKSTVSELLAADQGAAIWDSDDAKKVVPGFAGGLGAAAVHEESKALSDIVGAELRASGVNLIYPVVGHNREKLAKQIDQYQAEGYTVELLHVMVTPDEAARRMAARYLRTGRLIDPGYFASIGDKPKTTYQSIKGEADSYAEIDVNGPEGAERVTESAKSSHRALVAGRPLRPGGRSAAGGLRIPGLGRKNLAGQPTRKGRASQSLTEDMAAFADALRAAEEPEFETPSDRVIKSLKGFWQSWMHPRAPKGSPDGGKFQPKGGSDAAPKPKVTWQHMLPGEDGPPSHPKFDGPKPGKKWTGKLDTGYEKEAPLPKGAVKHPDVDNHGNPVWVRYPSKASPSVVWDDPEATATFTPGSLVPEEIQGIPTKLAYKPPQTAAEWAAVPGQNPEVEKLLPELTAPKGQAIGAGVIVQEDDGRVWIVSPTNGFGGYRQTFPKGTYEDDVPSLQANAIKEAFEESGLQVEITGVLGDFKRTTSVARFYLAKRVGGSPAHMGWESQAVRLAPVETLRQWLNKGYVDHPIVDALEDLTGEWTAKAFDESKHDRWPKGTPLGGQFKGMALGMPMPPKIGWKKDGSGPGANATYYNQMAAVFNAAAEGNIEPAVALYKKNFAIMDAFNPNVKTNSHTKWKAQVGQYAMELVMAHQDKKMAAKSASVVEGKLGALDISKWSLIKDKKGAGGVGGTAPGGLYTDENGQKWLVKGNLQGKDDARARNEVLASKLMEAAGIPAPEYKLVDLASIGSQYGGGLGVATKWQDGLVPVGVNPSGMTKKKAYGQFAVHAWLGNWDAVGETGDNLMMRPDGAIINIDPGGALLYRAMGEPKTVSQFSADAKDWASMRQPGNSAALVYGGMTADDLQASAKVLHGMTDGKISELVDAYWVDTPAMSKGQIKSRLKARRDSILAKANLPPMDVALESKANVTTTWSGPGQFKHLSDPSATKPANTGLFAVLPPKGISPGGKAAESLKTILGDAATMGEPKKAQVQMLGMTTNVWLTNAMNTDGKTKWDAMQMATYYGQLSAFHDGNSQAVIDEVPTAMAKYLYTAEAFEEANTKFGDGKSGSTWNWTTGAGVTTMAAGVSVASTPAATDTPVPASEYPEITDVDSAQKYAELAIMDGQDGLMPSEPKGPGMNGNVDDVNWLKKKYIEGFPPSPDVHLAILKNELYAGGTPQALALGGYGKALATYHEVKTGVTPKWGEKEQPGEMDDAALDAKYEAEAEAGGGGSAVIDALYEADEEAAIAAATVKPAMPDFAAAKLDASNSNASSHNAKVDLIAKLANVGNKSGILGLNYGTNTYGKKQAALANNALAALGSRHSVVPGQKKLSHPALSGNKANADAVAEIEEAIEVTAPKPAKPKKVVITKADLPPPPKFEASKKPWKNAVNKESVAAIEAAALEGNLTKLKNLTYPEHIDDEAGTLTGKKLPFSAHPSMKMQAYWSDSMKAVDDKFNPPKPLVPAKTIKKAGLATIAKAFPTAPLLTTVQQMPANQRVGFWMALGQVDASREDLLPTAPIKDEVGSSFKATLSGAHAKSGPLSKAFMRSVQGSGAVNDAYNQGNSKFNFYGETHDLAEVNKALHADAVELPEGSTVYKWLRMEPNMQASLMAAPVGTVLQNPGSSCNSMSPTNTSGFAGSDQSKRARIVYRAAKGAKMMPTWGRPDHGGFAGEQELTSLPGARLVLLGAKKVNGHFEIEVTLLPPHENSLKTKL